MSKRSRTSSRHPFDAVLIISFGGPQGLSDIRPFLENVLRGKAVPARGIEEVARNYEGFGGVSPLTRITLQQADGLGQRLESMGIDLPVYVGMRHWHPFLGDTFRKMAEAGVRNAIGFIAAPHHSPVSCGQYRQAVADARRKLAERGLPDIRVAYVESWYDHEGFAAAVAANVTGAISQLDPPLRDEARIVFTAHSIPVEMARRCRYVEQLATTAGLVAGKLGRSDWALVYQSRSGPRQEPWLGPDICDYLQAEHAKGLPAVVISPIGFTCDNIELLYDLDTRAANVCRELNLLMARAQAVNDHPLFIGMMADVVRQTCERYRKFPPLPIIAGGGKAEG